MEDAISQESERQNPQPDSHLRLCSQMDESSSSSSYSSKGPGIPYYPGEIPPFNPLQDFGLSAASNNPPAPKKPAPKLKKPPPVLPQNMRLKWGKFGRIFPPKHNWFITGGNTISFGLSNDWAITASLQVKRRKQSHTKHYRWHKRKVKVACRLLDRLSEVESGREDGRSRAYCERLWQLALARLD